MLEKYVAEILCLGTYLKKHDNYTNNTYGVKNRVNEFVQRYTHYAVVRLFNIYFVERRSIKF